jgi:hypothetical protein
MSLVPTSGPTPAPGAGPVAPGAPRASTLAPAPPKALAAPSRPAPESWHHDLSVRDFAAPLLSTELLEEIARSRRPTDEPPPREELDILESLIDQATAIARAHGLSGPGSVELVAPAGAAPLVHVSTENARHAIGQPLDPRLPKAKAAARVAALAAEARAAARKKVVQVAGKMAGLLSPKPVPGKPPAVKALPPGKPAPGRPTGGPPPPPRTS